MPPAASPSPSSPLSASIRRAVAGDLDDVTALVRGFYAVDGHDYDDDRVRAALGPLLRDDLVGQVWVVTDGSELTGYAVVTWGWSLESGGREALLDEIYVATSGSGVGSLLLEHCMTACRDAGAAVMFLETEAPNERARSFYARHGFTVEDSVWMGRGLGPGAAGR